jgi:hypothetical protein
LKLFGSIRGHFTAMRFTFAVFVIAVASLAVFSEELPLEARMSLEERVAQAKLIVAGRFGPRGIMGKHMDTSVRVEQVWFGAVPTNKSLFVSYTSTRWLIPEVASRTHLPKPGSRWIFFLTDEGVKQPAGTNYYTRAVGPYRYAHDGLELATEDMVKHVQELIAKKGIDR